MQYFSVLLFFSAWSLLLTLATLLITQNALRACVCPFGYQWPSDLCGLNLPAAGDCSCWCE